ncbi:MAG: hypothetical protein J7556_06445 [Acidovorax sp.]|nr:hypothetical protein [Acidovorax sp.]
MQAEPLDVALFGGTDAAELATALRHRLVPGVLLACDPQPEPCGAPAVVLLLGGSPDASAWRDLLAQAGWSYQVLYGEGAAQRLDAALRALHVALPAALREAPAPRTIDAPQRLRAWACEKCSDPQCEHRLFTALRDR